MPAIFSTKNTYPYAPFPRSAIYLKSDVDKLTFADADFKNRDWSESFLELNWEYSIF